MVGLTAGITALVSAMGIGFASILPTFLICAVGPILTFRILHIIWLKLSRMFNPNRDRGVEVFHSVNERVSKNGKVYYESNGDKFFHKQGSIYMYVIPKDGIPFSTDESAEYFMNDYGKWESWDRIEGAVRNIEDTLEDERSEGRRIDTVGKAFNMSDYVWSGSKRIK